MCKINSSIFGGIFKGIFVTHANRGFKHTNDSLILIKQNHGFHHSKSSMETKKAQSLQAKLIREQDDLIQDLQKSVKDKVDPLIDT